MCSIFKYNSVVGRNFDYEISYDEELRSIGRKEFGNQYKIIGMCTGIVKDYPLLYDGMNEYGLVCGGLAFTGNAVYNPKYDDFINIPSFDFTFQILSSFKSVDDVKDYLKDVNITDEAYSDEMLPSDLHWFIADEEKSIIVEQTKNGLSWFDGEVMTNNPSYHNQWKLYEISQEFDRYYPFIRKEFSTRGVNTYGLNGDYTSIGRFERLSYLREELVSSENDFNPVTQAFHLCSSVEQIYGVTPVDDKFEYTIYSVVYDMENLEVYLKNYDNLLLEKGVL